MPTWVRKYVNTHRTYWTNYKFVENGLYIQCNIQTTPYYAFKLNTFTYLRRKFVIWTNCVPISCIHFRPQWPGHFTNATTTTKTYYNSTELRSYIRQKYILVVKFWSKTICVLLRKFLTPGVPISDYNTHII